MSHPLLDVLLAAAEGNHPLVDGGVTFLPELDNGNRAIMTLTGHAFICTPQEPDNFTDLVLDGFGRALHPEVVLRVAADGVIGCNDATLAAIGLGGVANIKPTSQWDSHQRVVAARGAISSSRRCRSPSGAVVCSRASARATLAACGPQD